ncbi:MAG: hypothetical protein HQ581_14075 [Planctomycetes bacterium]|nr:hypothetical protein [Planctomycetota bacterium]
MRPEEKRPNRLQDGKSRARILLKKNAGWLPGFPLQSESGPLRWQAWPWESPGSGRVVSLDRGALRRMEMTLTKLCYHFPRALPQIVEDVGDWLTRMDHLLNVLKGAVHQRLPMEVETLLASSPLGGRWAERFRRIRATLPQLAWLLDAVAFLEFTGRSRCDPSVLEWIADHATTLSPLTVGRTTDRELLLTFCTLREDIHADLLPLLVDCMADASVCSVYGPDAYAYARAISAELKKALDDKPFEIPKKAPLSAADDVWRGFIGRLLHLDPKPRRQATALLESLLPTDLAAVAKTLTGQIDDEESRLLRRLRMIRHERPAQYRPKAERKKLKKQAEVVLANPAAERLLENADYILRHIPSILDESSLLRHWMRFLEYLPPKERSLRPGLFARWEQARLRQHDPRQGNRRFQQILPELSRLFARRGVHPALLRYWCEHVISGKPFDNDLIGDLIDYGYRDPETYQRWVRLLEATVYDRGLPIKAELLGSLEDFAQATSDVDRAAQLVAALAESEDEYFCENEIRAALSIANDASGAAAVLRKLRNDYEMVEPVATLGQHVGDDRLRRIVGQWVLDGRKKSLLRLASCTQIVVDLGFSVPTVPEARSSPDWLTCYPTELHTLLDALDEVASDARAVAAQLLRKEFPDPGDLQREMDAVGRKLDLPAARQDPRLQARLRKRLENLRSRIGGPPPTVTPQRLENLAKKISARIDHETVECFVRDCYALTAEKMRAAYGVDRFPDELFSPPKDQLLAGILQLKGVVKKLGLQLLLKSQQDPKSDFRDESRNAMFLQTLQEKGIRLEPWLSDAFEQTAKTAAGEPYRLAFTRDILDVLLMGFHFETCLSPGSVNFFSTIANALDINKQVVYGKTASGRVVGRCLFALADNGTILTYHRYAHSAADGFEAAVGQFAEQLAKAMGAALASTGQVATLVARSWYDDGAIASESAYNLQNPEGAVRTILRTADVSKIVKRLGDFFGSEEILKSVLGAVLLLDDFEQRKEIVTPLLDRFGFDTTVPMAQRLRLAVLARLAGKSETAAEIVRTLRVSSLPRRLKRFACGHCDTFHEIGGYREVLDLLIECNPSIALRTIRITRPENVKSDNEETRPLRKEMLLRCHELLGRDRAIP